MRTIEINDLHENGVDQYVSILDVIQIVHDTNTTARLSKCTRVARKQRDIESAYETLHQQMTHEVSTSFRMARNVIPCNRDAGFVVKGSVNKNGTVQLYQQNNILVQKLDNDIYKPKVGQVVSISIVDGYEELMHNISVAWNLVANSNQMQYLLGVVVPQGQGVTPKYLKVRPIVPSTTITEFHSTKCIRQCHNVQVPLTSIVALLKDIQITKNHQKLYKIICEIDWSHLCLQQFDKFQSPEIMQIC